LLATAAPAKADTVVNLNSEVNANLQTFTGGSNYPLGGTTLTVGGIPFVLANIPGGGTGIVQTAPASQSAPSIFDIVVDIPSAGTVYTLINSAFGQLGFTDGSVEFIGTNGADATFLLIQGMNIRDHFNGVFNNTIEPGTLSADFGPDRLDRQTFVLPGIFANSTLTDIRFSGFGNDPLGEPFLAAVTVASAAVPEPSSLTLGCVAALIGVGAWWRQRKVCATSPSDAPCGRRI
jgi:hypothetical protein